MRGVSSVCALLFLMQPAYAGDCPEDCGDYIGYRCEFESRAAFGRVYCCDCINSETATRTTGSYTQCYSECKNFTASGCRIIHHEELQVICLDRAAKKRSECIAGFGVSSVVDEASDLVVCDPVKYYKCLLGQEQPDDVFMPVPLAPAGSPSLSREDCGMEACAGFGRLDDSAAKGLLDALEDGLTKCLRKYQQDKQSCEKRPCVFETWK